MMWRRRNRDRKISHEKLLGARLKKMKDRVVLLSQSVSGFQNSIRHEHLLKASDLQDFDITLVTAPDNISIVPVVKLSNGFRKVISIGLFSWRFRRGGLDILDVLYRCYLIFRIRPTIVHCDGHRPATLFPALLAKFMGAKLVMEWVDLFSRDGIGKIRKGYFSRLAGQCDEWLEVKSKRVADHLIVISTYLKNRAICDLGINDTNVSLVRGGCMPIAIDQTKRSLSKSDKAIGFLGFELADLDDLLDALDAVVSLNTGPLSVRLVITGKDIDKLDGRIQKGYEAYLIRKGWLSAEAYEGLLTELDAFILPLRDDPRNCAKWPMKLGDYLSTGSAVVASNIGEIKAINDQYGCLYAYEHPSEISVILNDIFINGTHNASRIEECVGLAQGPLSWSTCAGVMLEAYSSARAAR